MERGKKGEGRGEKGEERKRGRSVAKILDFRELRVYQAARDGTKRIFRTSKRFPTDGKYSLTSQIRRASRSVAANIYIDQAER